MKFAKFILNFEVVKKFKENLPHAYSASFRQDRSRETHPQSASDRIDPEKHPQSASDRIDQEKHPQSASNRIDLEKHPQES